MDRARFVAMLRLALLTRELRKGMTEDELAQSRRAVASHQAGYERANGPTPTPERSVALQGLLDLVRRHGKKQETPAGVVAKPIARPQALWHNDEFRPNRCLACIAGGRDECPHYPPPLVKMAIANNKVGDDLGEEPTQGVDAEKQREIERQVGTVPRVFNYSHLLTNQHHALGYQLHIVQRGDSLHAKVFHNNPSRKPSYVGGVTGAIFAGQLGIHRADMDLDHRRKGLGPAALEALMTHAHHHHNVRTVSGAEHSTSAHRMHQKVAQKHKLGYRGREKGSAPGHGFYDDKYGAYRYNIK